MRWRARFFGCSHGRGVEENVKGVAHCRQCRVLTPEGPAGARVPEVARACLAALGSQLRILKAQILEFDRRILAWLRSSATVADFADGYLSVRHRDNRAIPCLFSSLETKEAGARPSSDTV